MAQEEKILVLDIDGTLTNSKKEITENTKRGIKNIMESQNDTKYENITHQKEDR